MSQGGHQAALHCCWTASPFYRKDVILIHILNNNIEFTHVKLLLVLSDKCIVEHCFLCSLSPMGGESKGSQLHRDELCYKGV